MAGYSSTPLARKLGITAGARVVAVDPPDGYRDSLEPLPEDVTFVADADDASRLVHLFTADRATLVKALTRYRKVLASDAVVWISWPKKASRVATDITEDVIRDVALPLGFVDVKVCAVDDVWSGLKLVVRKALR